MGEKGKNGKWEEEEGRKGKSKLNFDAGKMGEGGETVSGGGFKIASPAKMFFVGNRRMLRSFLLHGSSFFDAACKETQKRKIRKNRRSLLQI